MDRRLAGIPFVPMPPSARGRPHGGSGSMWARFSDAGGSRAMAAQDKLNGVDVAASKEKVKAVKENPKLGTFHFRTRTKWQNCGHSETTVTDFYGVGQEFQYGAPFVLSADEPHVLLGGDKGANPVEHLLHVPGNWRNAHASRPSWTS